MWAEVALVLAFVVVGGFFAAAELALISLRPGQVARLAQQGRRGRQIAWLVEDPNTFLSAVQIGVTLAGFFSASVGAVTLAAPLASGLRSLGAPDGLSETLALVAVTVVIAYVSLVLGELAPKRLALQRAEGIARFSAVPIAAVARATRPIIWLLARSSDLVVRLAGGNPRLDREVMTEEELRDLVASHEDLTLDERRLIGEVLDAGDRPLREIMIPRLDVSALQVHLDVQEAILATADKPYSRYPVVDGGLDDVAGFVHIRDLLTAEPRTASVGELARPIMRLPDSRRALPALVEMRRDHAHLAVVVDEYGGSAGIVTLEDLIEEIVGDITDEFDVRTGDPRHDPSARFRARDDDGSDGGPHGPPALPSGPVDAQLRLDEFADRTGVTLPPGPYDTAAGWIVSRLGRIPVAGDAAEHDDDRVGRVRLQVSAVRGRRVESLLIEQLPPQEGSEQAAVPGGG